VKKWEHSSHVWSFSTVNGSLDLPRYFLHSLSWCVTDLCRRFNSAFRAGSLVFCHCFLKWFFRHIAFRMRACVGGRSSSRQRYLGLDSDVFEIVLYIFLTPASIRSSLGRSGLDGNPVPRLTWNTDHSVLKSRPSGGFMMDDRYCVRLVLLCDTI
jgi:hypothetical protein